MSVWDPLRNYPGEFGSPDRGANRFFGEGGRRPAYVFSEAEVWDGLWEESHGRLHTIMYLVAVKDRAEVDRVYYRAEHHPIDE